MILHCWPGATEHLSLGLPSINPGEVTGFDRGFPGKMSANSRQLNQVVWVAVTRYFEPAGVFGSMLQIVASKKATVPAIFPGKLGIFANLTADPRY